MRNRLKFGVDGVLLLEKERSYDGLKDLFESMVIEEFDGMGQEIGEEEDVDDGGMVGEELCSMPE